MVEWGCKTSIFPSHLFKLSSTTFLILLLTLPTHFSLSLSTLSFLSPSLSLTHTHTHTIEREKVRKRHKTIKYISCLLVYFHGWDPAEGCFSLVLNSRHISIPNLSVDFCSLLDIQQLCVWHPFWFFSSMMSYVLKYRYRKKIWGERKFTCRKVVIPHLIKNISFRAMCALN